jgi:hypothetical protein
MVRTNVVDLFGSTFSDHMLPYFTKDFNRDNERLARQWLERMYDCQIDPAFAPLWTPERLLDSDVLDKILDMGYASTLLDQNTHLFHWLGRTESLTDGGYRVNSINGVRGFVIHNVASGYRFAQADGGMDLALRGLLNRKARSGTQDQVVTLLSNWEDFTVKAQADAYDANIRWAANRPWVVLITHEQINRGDVDAWGDPAGDAWAALDRGYASRSKQSHDWVNHATQGNFDEWYVGSPREEGLEGRRFPVRPGVSVPFRYGMLYSDGIVAEAWQRVQSIGQPDLAALARAALHASVFQTAFHNQSNNDLRRYSTGAYVWPDTGSNTLATFARVAQGQTRFAAVYRRVDQWAAIAASVTTPQRGEEDVDLDGETELLLYNSRIFAIFERIGGRMTGAWARDRITGSVRQVIGNPVGYAGSETEEEGASNALPDGSPDAYRTSALKDWWDGSRPYVNDLYAAEDRTNGWRFSSPDGRVRKTVTLAPFSAAFEVEYQTEAPTLYVRHGLSPDLRDLLESGQRNLPAARAEGGVLTLINTNPPLHAAARIRYADAGHNTSLNPQARDEDTNRLDYATVNMRNQAQTQQVELYGSGVFRFALELLPESEDLDADALPDLWERIYGLDTNALGGASDDADEDGMSNEQEYRAGTSPVDDGDLLRANTLRAAPDGVIVRFPARPQREYSVWYGANSPAAGGWTNATPDPIRVATDQEYEWTDDGSHTDPAPDAATNRFYRVRARLP